MIGLKVIDILSRIGRLDQLSLMQRALAHTLSSKLAWKNIRVTKSSFHQYNCDYLATNR